jgi:peptidoglycan/LPS O-acetylase OafA/YrhL
MTDSPNLAQSLRVIADIEILRAIAILFVLIEQARIHLFLWIEPEHSRLYYYFGFWPGADLFFAISGFVIARGLLPALDRATDRTDYFRTVIAFWVRRAWRLLPSAGLWLAATLALAVFFNRSGAFGPFSTDFESALAAILGVANFHTLAASADWSRGAGGQYWTLSLEEQFYLLLPIAALVFAKRLSYVLWVGVLAQLFLKRFGPGTTDFGHFLGFIRSDALFLGVLIALWSRHPTYALFDPNALNRRPAAGLILLALLTLCLAVVGSPYMHIVYFAVGLIALISAALVLVASFDGDYLVPPGGLKRLLAWIGSRSYAIYLIHVPAYLATREIWYRIEPAGTVFGPAFTLRFGITATVLLIVLAVETPLRRRGAGFAERVLARAA